MCYTIPFFLFFLPLISLYLPILLPSIFNNNNNNHTDENGKRSTRAIMIELFPFDLVRKVQCAHIFYDDKHSFPPLRLFCISICIRQCLGSRSNRSKKRKKKRTNKQTKSPYTSVRRIRQPLLLLLLKIMCSQPIFPIYSLQW